MTSSVTTTDGGRVDDFITDGTNSSGGTQHILHIQKFDAGGQAVGPEFTYAQTPPFQPVTITPWRTVVLPRPTATPSRAGAGTSRCSTPAPRCCGQFRCNRPRPARGSPWQPRPTAASSSRCRRPSAPVTASTTTGPRSSWPTTTAAHGGPGRPRHRRASRHHDIGGRPLSPDLGGRESHPHPRLRSAQPAGFLTPRPRPPSSACSTTRLARCCRP